jgi:hypothetical protein
MLLYKGLEMELRHAKSLKPGIKESLTGKLGTIERE